MDGSKPRQGTHSGHRAQHRPVSHGPARPQRNRKERHSGQQYFLVRTLGKVAADYKDTLWNRFRKTSFAQWPDRSIWHRVYAFAMTGLFIFSTIAGILQPFLNDMPYKLTDASRAIIPERNDHLATLLKYDTKEMTYAYNAGYKPAPATASLKKTGNGDPRITASFAKDAKKGVSVTDPVNNVDFKMTPKFGLGAGKQDKNQVLYPVGGTDGYLVYTAQVASVKEDIVLQQAGKDKMTFKYELGLDGLAAKLEKDGSVGIYGSDLPLYGNVATGSDKDADLLKKAKDNAPKTKFLFGIPAPVVKESGKQVSSVVTSFSLSGSTLTLSVSNLKTANYPLTIDPSIYVQTAAQLMYGNNESNVAFDVATEQFKKGFTTGARINNWTETGAMNDATYDQSVTGYGGYIYRAGGRSGRVMPYVADKLATTQSTASTSTVLNMPSNRPTGYLYIALIAYSSGTVSAVPSGWTLINNTNSTIYAYYHVSSSTEPSTYTWTTSTSQQYSAVILRIANADTSGGTIATWQKSTGTGTGTAPTYPAVTPGQQGALVLSAAGWTPAVPATRGYSPSGYTDVASMNSAGTGAANTASLVASSLDSPPLSGASTGTATTTTGTTSAWGATTFTIYGSSASGAYQNSVEWAHFNSTTGSIDSPAPGSNAVACSGWCADSAYALPISSPSQTNGAGLVGMSLVAYNGYLYAIGGYDGTYIKSTVYIAKLGANGEPSLWHPTSADQSQWAYWFKDTGLNGGSSGARMYQAAYAYNGKMYVLGGDNNTSSASGALTTVEVADILPNGTLGSWSSGQALTTARSGLSVQGYNGYLYAIGGDTNGTTLTTVQFSHLNSDGTMNGWQTAAADGTNTMANARTSMGGVMSGIWGGYLYVAGGCKTMTSGRCSGANMNKDMQIASINADGTLDIWNTMAYVNNQRIGASFIAWQGSLYRFGGCSQQDTSTGDCYATHIDIQYGNINQDGDASTVSVSTDPGSGNCQGTDPYDCSLPPGGTGSGQGGRMLTAVAILNGFIYVIGGCTTYQCTTMTTNTSYAAIDSNGRLKSPPTCAGGTNGSWCVDDTDTINNNNNGLGGGATTVFGGYIYVVGGHQGGGGLANAVFRNNPNADGSLPGAWAEQRMTTLAFNETLGMSNAITYSYAYARANPSNASQYPGNLYMFGGCTALSSGNCSTYTDAVYKCNINPNGSIDTDNGSLGASGHNPCSKTNQLQIGTVSGASGAGIGQHAGAVYANYIYLVGGNAPGTSDLTQIRYAKFDNNNNVVTVGSGWTVATSVMGIGRSRGSAFGYNGYLYVVGGYNTGNATTLKDIQYAKVNVGSGDLESPGNSFNTSIVTINQRWGLGLALSNSYAYVVGGCNTGTPPNCASTGLDPTVQTFQVYNNDSGAPATYSYSSNMYNNSSGATDRLGAGAAVYNGYLYVAGGCTGSTECASTTTDVQSAPIDANGSVGTWTTMTGSGLLPAARGFGQLEVVGGTLYFIGGQTTGSTTSVTSVYYATPNGSGVISSWSTATSGGVLPAARTQFSSVVWNGHIYVTGGYTGATPSVSNVIYMSNDLSAGGAPTSWTTTGMTTFNVARSGHVAIAYANNIYILGGYDGANYLSDVQFAKIDSSGNIGSWTYTSSLPSPIRQADGFAANGYMYIFGGRSSTNDCAARTLIAPISANTTIASGNNPTGIGEWYQTNRNFDGGRYGVAATYYQGKAFLLGGGCQGIVMQDDFDGPSSPYYDSSQWNPTTIANMAADFRCKSTSTSRTLSGTTGGTGGAVAATKAVNVASGGTVYFKLYTPTADINTGGGTCYKGESPLLFGRDGVRLQYNNNGGGWTNIGGQYAAVIDPLQPQAVTIPAGAQGTSTQFRWYLDNSGSNDNDSFALEDVYIVASGSNGIAYATNSRVTQTGLLSQQQLAIYSRQIDAGSDVFPTKWLMNGIDNSIGAHWQLSYRSMNDPLITDTNIACGGSAMSSYGQTTNYGDVTLGSTGIYTVKNGAGTNIGCGRYFFMTISIDASQTYGYPDDITRGPTLDNLTLFYNSNPGKRLIHGKTFTEGIQQPLDTQPN